MQCPNCPHETLHSVITTRGIEIDRCKHCGGIWLDGGEIYSFVKRPSMVSQKLLTALNTKQPTHKKCPRTNGPMVEITYDNKIKLDYCETTKGIWLDKGELKELIKYEKNFSLSLSAAPKQQKPSIKNKTNYTARSKLQALPNLFARTCFTLILLYAFLGLLAITAVEFGGVSPHTAFYSALGISVLMFLIGPFLMDLTVGFLYKAQWVEQHELPSHLNAFVSKLCKQHNMKLPKFAIIQDGSPQAFTYGHTPNNARIVLSKGLLTLLNKHEVEAVTAHEIGHAKHWDMLLMSAAQLVPLIAYYIYRTLISSDNKRSGFIAFGAYAIYFISEYIVLWFSRTRELHADRFAGFATKNPAALSSALVKIAYGLASQEDVVENKKENKKTTGSLQSVGALGIFDKKAANTLALTNYNASNTSSDTTVNKEHLKHAMRWDQWNPWAKWYELNSTHPLVARRLKHLSNQAVHLGQQPYIHFNEKQPESYWDEFFVDICIAFASLLSALCFGIPIAQYVAQQQNLDFLTFAGPFCLFFFGLGMIVKNFFVYPRGFFPETMIASLLKVIKVSAVRPVPCKLKGKIIGRGIPGYIFSEDFVLQDQSGIIFLDYRQPLSIWQLIFALLKSGKYTGQEVEVTGWYHRSHTPYVEILKIQSATTSSTSWVPALKRLLAFGVTVAGAYWIIQAMGYAQ